MNRSSWLPGIGILMLVIVSCDQTDPTALLTAAAPASVVDGGDPAADVYRETVPTSLHATAAGMRYWYERPDGFRAMTRADYDPMSCATCHVAETDPESCDGCHDSPTQGRGTVDESTCLTCHARQQAELDMGLPDVHRAAGLRCWDCHTGTELHGDGQAYASMFEPGVMATRCTRCHSAPHTAAHQHHGDRVACVSCHMVTSVTCVNCHFGEEVTDHQRIAAGKVTGWQFLGNYRGQVYPLNFQSLEYEGNTFVAWGPYSGHTITAEGRACEDCHASANVAELTSGDGTLQVLAYDPTRAPRMLAPAQGVIPVPENYRTALLFDFVSLSDGTRTFLEAGPDASHMLFAEPLTELQMAALATPQTADTPLPAGPPLCDGVPATIWVGMDPASMPAGASITPASAGHEEGAHEEGEHEDGSGGCAEGGGYRYTIIGTRGNDVIVGSTTPDSIVALRGDDIVCGRQARDFIAGHIGDDRLFGEQGADRIFGDAGNDLVDGGEGWDALFGGTGDDWLLGKEGQDSIFGEDGDDWLFGGKSPDVLDGGRGLNHLEYGPEICEGDGPGGGGEPGGGSGGGGHDDGSHDDGGCGEDHEDGGCEGL